MVESRNVLFFVGYVYCLRNDRHSKYFLVNCGMNSGMKYDIELFFSHKKLKKKNNSGEINFCVVCLFFSSPLSWFGFISFSTFPFIVHAQRYMVTLVRKNIKYDLRKNPENSAH